VKKDILLLLDLSSTKARGQCYGGTVAMSACKSGMAMDDEPKAILLIINENSLDLTINDTEKMWLYICMKLLNLLKVSTKRNL